MIYRAWDPFKENELEANTVEADTARDAALQYANAIYYSDDDRLVPEQISVKAGDLRYEFTIHVIEHVEFEAIQNF